MSLSLEGVSLVVGGTPHIHPTDLRFERGTINVLLGPTLAGKTSLMRLMAGLDRPTTGRIVEDGRDVTRAGVGSRNVAMVYQQFINYPALSVYENIASPLRVRRASRSEIDTKVRHAADLLKLGDHLEKTPLQLSGGQQQRTAIARAIVKGASLVLLDEPLANLDYKLREELRIELPKIFEATGAIFVYATTEPSEALLLGGNTAALHQGRVTQFGPTVQVYRRPSNRTTAQVFSDPPMNVATLTIAAGRAAIGEPGSPAVAEFGADRLGVKVPDGRYTLGFRPHHAGLARRSEADIQVGGVAAVSELTGSESFVHADIGPERWIALAPGVHEYHPGATVDFFLDPGWFYLFAADGRLAAAPAALNGG